MPLYDYDCLACGRRIEVVHGVHAPGPTHCPNCGAGPLKKAISAPAVHFKGSGWAKRDRRATITQAAAKASGDTESPADGSKADQPDKTTSTSKESAATDGSKDAAKDGAPAASSNRADTKTAGPAATKTGA
jgi:putative FmdB family regulatory protein